MFSHFYVTLLPQKIIFVKIKGFSSLYLFNNIKVMARSAELLSHIHASFPKIQPLRSHRAPLFRRPQPPPPLLCLWPDHPSSQYFTFPPPVVPAPSPYCAPCHCVLYSGRNRRIWGMVLMGPREEKLGEESQIWLMMYWAKLTPPTLVL